MAGIPNLQGVRGGHRGRHHLSPHRQPRPEPRSDARAAPHRGADGPHLPRCQPVHQGHVQDARERWIRCREAASDTWADEGGEGEGDFLRPRLAET